MSGYNRCDTPKQPSIVDTQGRCWYCGCELLPRGIHDSRASTRDHVFPQNRSDAVTTVSCCYLCNQRKGKLTLEEFRLLLAFRLRLIPGAQYKFLFFGERKKIGRRAGESLMVTMESLNKLAVSEGKSAQIRHYGLWRRLVAHLPWVQKVSGSNPDSPTKEIA